MSLTRERLALGVFVVTLVFFALFALVAGVSQIQKEHLEHPRAPTERQKIAKNSGEQESGHLGPAPPIVLSEIAKKAEPASNLVTVVIKAVISIIVLIFAFVLMLLRSSSEETRKWATGIIGVVVGFSLGSAG
jgi:hypothetical protein